MIRRYKCNEIHWSLNLYYSKNIVSVNQCADDCFNWNAGSKTNSDSVNKGTFFFFFFFSPTLLILEPALLYWCIWNSNGVVSGRHLGIATNQDQWGILTCCQQEVLIQSPRTDPCSLIQCCESFSSICRCRVHFLSDERELLSGAQKLQM